MSNGQSTGALPGDIRPIRVYTQKSLRHEEDKLSYGRLSTLEGHPIVEPCRSISNRQLRQKCKGNQEIVINATSDVPLLWGLYEKELNAGSYQLVVNGLEVYQGAILVELVDENIQRITSQTFHSKRQIKPIPFRLQSNKQRFEIRIQASENAEFKPPTHFIISD